MTTDNDFVIKTDGLGKTYQETIALKALNLQVPQHSIFGLLGPNGAGKTSAVRLLLGLARPTAGKAQVFGLDSVKDSLEIRRRIGYLPQEPRFYDYLTAREILDFSLRFYFSGSKLAMIERIACALELVGLTNKADRPVKGFSGGERQRLGIAQAQVHHPDLLILDEPTASLDPMGRRAVLRVMERLRESCTLFYSTHILDDVQRVSDKVAILNQGRLIAQAPIADMLSEAGDTIYSVALRGDVQPTYERVASQPWVSQVQPMSPNGRPRWYIHVTDATIAEGQLLSLLVADDTVTVTEFGLKKRGLEDVFVNLVAGGLDD